MEQFDEHVAVTSLRLAVAAKALADQFGQGSEQIRAAADMDFVHLNSLFSILVAADLEGVSPLRGPGNQHVVVALAKVDNRGHALANSLRRFRPVRTRDQTVLSGNPRVTAAEGIV